MKTAQQHSMMYGFVKTSSKFIRLKMPIKLPFLSACEQEYAA